MSNPTSAEVRALLAVLDGIMEAVRVAGPMGAPGGVMYAAMMAQGCTLDQFNQIMSAMVRAGKLQRQGDCYVEAAPAAAAA